MLKSIFLITCAFIIAGPKLHAQDIETVNSIVLSTTPAKSYIVNREGRLTPNMRVSASPGFFMRANGEVYGSPSPLRNFVKTQIMRSPDGKSTVGADYPVKSTYYEYYDGLGSMRQAIKVGFSPQGNDLITVQELDEFGRTPRHYLPYTQKSEGTYRDTALVEQLRFYNGTPGVAKDSEPFGISVYDDSPQNKVTESFANGWQWHQAVPSKNYLRISGPDDVAKFSLGSDGLPSFSIGQFFAKGTFVVEENSDEAGLVSREYSDAHGYAVLKRSGDVNNWHETYYFNDRNGRALFIFPPEASARLAEYNATGDKGAFLDRWCFQYRYDRFGRLIEKRVPGADWVFFVFDRWDRQVLSQDGNQRTSAEWTFTKYDAHNRVIITGKTTGSRADLELALSKNPNRFEDRSRNAIGYTNRTFPVHAESALLTINYYDCYNFLTYPGWDSEGLTFTPVTNALMPDLNSIFFVTSETETTKPSVRGYATGSKVRVINDGPTRWLNHVTYYNRQYRPVQTISENHLGGTDVVTRTYDRYTGIVLKALRNHRTSYASVKVLEEFEYDHQDRLLKAYHQINNQPRVLMVANRYNELGQLVERNLHSTDEATFLQSVDFSYNIQGWRTHINNSGLKKDGITNNDSNDLFGMEVVFNAAMRIKDGAFVTSPRYDGNVAALKWKTNTLATTPQEAIYGFSYDHFRRMDKSYYATDGINWRGNPGLYNESVLYYDRNGNIGGSPSAAFQRYGKSNGVRALIDNLSYRYTGNQLSNVLDNSNNKFGFTDKPGVPLSVDEFHYDRNGNLIDDLNKSISRIGYNHLNLVTSVEFTRVSPVRTDKVAYVYDAQGVKLSTQVDIGNDAVWKTDYTNGVQYDNDQLTHLSTPEGRAVFDGTKYEYEYFLRDHLGNVRVVCGLSSKTSTYLATMEDALESLEKNTYGFGNISETRSIGYNVTLPMPSVASPNKSAKCNGYSDSLTVAKPIGPAKSFRVKAGDKIYAEVFARYNQVRKESKIVLPAILSSFVTSALNVTSSENPLLYTRLAQQAPLAAAGVSYADAVPKGYLVLLYFDDNYNFIRPQAVGISPGAYRAFEKLTLSFSAERSGHVFVYVANESSASATVDVFFDDLYLIHEETQTEPQVWQASDYYPFGLSFNEYAKDRIKTVSTTPVVLEPVLRNRYLFQGQEWQKDLSLGWYQFKSRMHDPSIGRFGSVDPLAGDYVHLSPYAFSGNELINAIELEGKQPEFTYILMKYFSPIAIKFDFSMTSHNTSIGYNVSYGIPKALPFSYRAEFGKTYHMKDILQKAELVESRSARETSFFGLISFQSTQYTSLRENPATNLYENTSQTTGMVTLGMPMMNISYENDWFPESTMRFLDPLGVHPLNGGDGGDRFRTAALSVNVGMFSGGFKFLTGDAGPYIPDAVNKFIGGKAGTYVENMNYGIHYQPDRYRLGLLYGSFGSVRLGLDGEAVRHQIQNVWTHDNLREPSPWFRVLHNQNQLYFGFSNGSSTQW